MVDRIGFWAVGVLALVFTLAAPGADAKTLVSPLDAFGLLPPPMFGGLSTGSFGIADNESPRPTDRVFFNYNYFNDSSFNIQRETIGFEKTIFGGNASVELRLPFFQSSFEDSQVGDLSAVFKYAFLNTPDTALSGGMMITLPTAPGSDNVTNFQPFVAWQRTFGNFYVQGIHSLIIPFNSPYTDTVSSNNVAAGFWLYRAAPSQFISAIIPTIELNLDRNLNFPDASQTALTLGAHFNIYNAVTFGAAAVVPMGGPKAFDTETVLNLNFRF